MPCPCAAAPARPAAAAAPCASAQLGVALCPCDGSLDPAAYRPVVERLVAGVERDPALLLGPLAERVAALAREGRFEEAGWVRDRHHALARALERRRAWQALAGGGLVCAEHPDGGGALIDHGRLAASWEAGGRPPLLPLPDGPAPNPLPRCPPTRATPRKPTSCGDGWRRPGSQAAGGIGTPGPAGPAGGAPGAGRGLGAAAPKATRMPWRRRPERNNCTEAAIARAFTPAEMAVR